MNAAKIPKATIEIQTTHFAILEPVVPEIRDSLKSYVLEFDASGPLGHTVTLARSDRFSPVIRHSATSEVLRLPQGAIPAVITYLKRLGYGVTVRDRRNDSPRWVCAVDWKSRVLRAVRGIVARMESERALRVIVRNDNAIFEAIVAVAEAYPSARIAIAVPTYKLLWQVMRRLRSYFDGFLGLYTAKTKQPGRVSVGLIGQLPRGNQGEIDLLILPYAERTVSDASLRIITSGQFLRILSFSRVRWTRDDDINLRFRVIAGGVYPPEIEKSPVTAIMLDTRGTKPGTIADAFEVKEKLYWQNPRRNRRIAEVAKRLAMRTKKSIRSVVNGDTELVTLILEASSTGVAILVESPAHARELAELLPGWAVWTANDLEIKTPKKACGVITTELAADETVILAGVLIRATGTKYPLPDIDWPWKDEVPHGVLIDFRDTYHPVSSLNAQARRVCYKEADMTVYTCAE